MEYSGKIIALEGLDGCGKTTQLQLLAQALTAQGREVICTREPGGTALGEELRNLLLNRSDLNWEPESELFAFMASIAQSWKEVIEPALRPGIIVLCDRFYLSAMAYQGYGKDLNANLIRVDFIKTLFPLGLPIIHLVLDMRLEDYHTPDGVDRYDLADSDFRRRVWIGYRKLGYELKNAHLIDGTGSPEEVYQRIMVVLERRI